MRPAWVTALIVLVILLGLALGGLAYFNHFVLPVKLKQLAEVNLSQALGRKVSVRAVEVKFLTDITLHDLQIAEDPKFGSEPFVRIDQIKGRFLYLPLFNKGQMVVPSLRIVAPQIKVLQDPAGAWNIQGLGLLHQSPAKSLKQIKLIVPRIVIEQGDLQLLLQPARQQIRLHLENIGAQAGVSLPANLHYSLSSRLGLGTYEPVPLEMGGSYDLRSKRVSWHVRTTLPLEMVSKFVPVPPGLRELQMQGKSTLEMNMAGKIGETSLLDLSLQTQGLDWTAVLENGPVLPPLIQTPMESFKGQGDLSLKLSAQMDPAMSSLRDLKQLRGTLELKEITLSNLPRVGQLNKIKGRILLDESGAHAQQMSALLPSEEVITFAGDVKNDSNRSFDLKLNTQLAVHRLPVLPRRFLEKLDRWKAVGTINVDAKATGALLPKFSMEPNVQVIAEGISANLPYAGPVRDFSGSLQVQQDLITVSRVRGRVRDLPFRAGGTLVNFAQPEVSAQLSWGKLAAELQAQIEGQRIEFQTLSGTYGDSSFRAFGEVQNIRHPVGNLYGEVKFKVEDLLALHPNPPKWAAELKPQGEISAWWLQKGPLRQVKEWEAELRLNSPTLTVGQVRLQEVAVELRQREGTLFLHSAQAKGCEGELSVIGTWPHGKNQEPWSLQVVLQNLDLALLSKELRWKDALSGKFSMMFEGSGQSTEIAAIEGTGSAQVRGARVWELPFFGSFAELLQMPTLKSIVFQEADGPFHITRGQIRSDGFQMRSPQATLSVMGAGGLLQGLDSPISFRILPTLSSDLIPAETKSKVSKAIVKGTSYLVGELQITGTWKAPKTNFVAKKLTQILNEQIFNLQDAVGDLL